LENMKTLPKHQAAESVPPKNVVAYKINNRVSLMIHHHSPLS
jgi:hypothetical protein